MARTESTMLPLSTPAPYFHLPDVRTGHFVELDDLRTAPALLVAFICNHCPYVKYIRNAWSLLANEYAARGVAVVAISSNNAEEFPADGPGPMAEEALAAGYRFPYLYDETQAVARAYHAACTPDFYIFDKDQLLVYRGQMDSSRKSNDYPTTGQDLRVALDATLVGRRVPSDQKPSLGCNIKWKPGNEPPYFSL